MAIAWVEQRRGAGYGRMRCGLIVTEDVIVFSAITYHKRLLYATQHDNSHHRTLTANSRTSAHTSFSLYIAFTFFTRPAEPALITFV